MIPVIQSTADGSLTIMNSLNGMTYHSLHGAISESNHVYIKAGLEYYYNLHEPLQVDILEMGFGAGLNAYLTAEWLKDKNLSIQYKSIEKFPLTNVMVEEYGKSSSFNSNYYKIHQIKWDQWEQLNDQFSLYKHFGDLFDISFINTFDIVYYDAFAPTAQPDLWTEDVFAKIAATIKPNGVLVTYCAKGIVKRALRAVGFDVKAIPGPPRKREMLRATLRGNI